MKRIYLDNASSTKIDKRVLKAMMPYLTTYYGNSDSAHLEGRIAHDAIEDARTKCANALGCKPEEIIFTSGASEGNAFVLNNYMVQMNNNVHSSISLNTDAIGNSDLVALSLMDNIMGHIHTCSDIKMLLDITQAIGKIEINLKNMGSNILFATMSGHKIGAPKGIGLLYINSDVVDMKKLKPLIYGHQEGGLRGGTRDVASIVGLSEALILATEEIDINRDKIKKMSRYVRDNLQDIKLKKIESENGFINITFNNITAHSAVIILDKYGVAVSAGSACNTGLDIAEPILLENGYKKDDALKTIRISIGKDNTIKEMKSFCEILKMVVAKYDV